MWKRIMFLLSALRTDGRLMWHAVRHPKAPVWLRIGAFAPMLYLIFPLDLIPDTIPLLGVIDDALIIGFLPKIWHMLLDRADPQIRADAQAKVGDPRL